VHQPPLVPTTTTLADRVRAVLAEEGRPPSRKAVAGWIRGGAVTVDGRTLRNPAAVVDANARISLDLSALSEEEGLFGKRPGPRGALAVEQPAPPPWLLHLDAQLVVIDRAGFPAALSPEALAEAVSRALAAWRARPLALVAVPDPSGAGSGPVLLAASKAVAARLTAAVRNGHVLETLLSLRSPPLAAPGEVVAERGATTSGGSPLSWALVQRDDAPLGPSPAGTRPLVPPHRSALVLKHPKTNRRLEFACDPSAPFAEAFQRMRAGAEPG
jgi:hypothetical protein